MIIVDDIRAVLSDLKKRAIRYVLSHRIRARHPTLNADPSVVWDYPFDRPDALSIGRGVTVRANCEILVYPTAQFGTHEGRLVLADGAVISTNVNIRAAGGCISVGAGSGIGQNTVLVAASHQVKLGTPVINSPWDNSRSGVTVGANVWIGANCVLLAGSSVGDNSVVAAGSVVRGEVPAGELWGGVPARMIKRIGAG